MDKLYEDSYLSPPTPIPFGSSSMLNVFGCNSDSHLRFTHKLVGETGDALTRMGRRVSQAFNLRTAYKKASDG